MTRTLASLLAVTLLAACGDDTPITGGTTSTNALAPTVLAAVTRTHQDEYHAEETYLRVLSDLGPAIPFQNVVYAEQRHSSVLSGILERRGLTIPVSEWNVNNVPRFPTLRAACAGAEQAELDNIALYDSYLSLDLPTDVRNVFTNNRRASLQNHLPAFAACK